MATTAKTRTVTVRDMSGATALWTRLYTGGWDATLRNTQSGRFTVETNASPTAVKLAAGAALVAIAW